MAGRRTTGKGVVHHHHINLSNKYSTLQVEDDDGAAMSGDAGNDKTLVPKKTPTIDNEKKRRLKNTEEISKTQSKISYQSATNVILSNRRNNNVM